MLQKYLWSDEELFDLVEKMDPALRRNSPDQPILDGLDWEHDPPFRTMTWEHWWDMQRQAICCFTRFQHALENKDPHSLAYHALEMQEIAFEFQKEALFWVHTKPGVLYPRGQSEPSEEMKFKPPTNKDDDEDDD